MERAEATALTEGMRQRRELDAQLELEAVGYVRTWLEAKGISEIRVDDEHETPAMHWNSTTMRWLRRSVGFLRA